MSREQKIRAVALALKVETEAFQARIAALSETSDQAEVLALLADLQDANAKARREMSELLGLTPAAMQLILGESDRLYRATGGNTTEDDLRTGKIGKLIAGLRAVRDDGGEA